MDGGLNLPIHLTFICLFQHDFHMGLLLYDVRVYEAAVFPPGGEHAAHTSLPKEAPLVSTISYFNLGRNPRGVKSTAQNLQ